MATDHDVETPAPTPEAAFLALLEAERDCLIALEAALTEETAALHTLEAEAVFAAARRKTTLTERHQVIAEERTAALVDVAPGARCLTEVRAARPDLADRVEALQSEMQGVVHAIAHRSAWNQAFAETGREVVEAALGMVTRLRAGSRTTYAADGRVQTGVQRAGVTRRA